MISSRRWISFRASAVDKPDGNLGKGDGVFILSLIKFTAYILSNVGHFGYISHSLQIPFKKLLTHVPVFPFRN
jgi:hypothetical protein